MANMAATNLSTQLSLRPIEFILPNSILSLTEWKTQMPQDQEVTFSMEHLYLLINYLLGHFFKPGLPLSIVSKDLFSKPIEILDENKLEIIDHYWLIMIISFSLLLCAFLVPVLCFMCCCFCTDKKTMKSRIGGQHHHHYLQHYRHSSSGGGGSSGTSHYRNSHRPSHGSSSRHKATQSYQVESACDCCFRPILSLLLLTLLVLCLIFIVCAFVTNDSVYNGVQQLPQSAHSSLSDLEIYLNNTQNELDILFKTNFAQLESQLRQNLNMSGDIVKNRLAIISEAISIDNLTQIVTNLQPILYDLKRLINNTNELKFLTAQLRGKITRSKQDLADFFASCRHAICNDLEKKYQNLMQSFTVSARIEGLPRLSPIVDKIEYLLKQDIVSEIRKGKDKLDYLSNEIQTVVNAILPTIGQYIGQANTALNHNVESINQVLAQPIPYIRSLQQQVSKSESFITKHEHYIQYLGLSCAAILMIILTCYLIGLLCGSCQDQPTRFNYHTRSKKSELCFYFGIVLFFLTFTVLLIFSTLSFSLGVVSDRSMCFFLENISDPQSEKIISLFQHELEKISFENTAQTQELKPMFSYLKNVQLAEILTRCHQNRSLFNVLQLSLDHKIKVKQNDELIYLNLSEIILFKERTNIEAYLNSLLNKLNVNPSNIVLLTSHGQELINVLKETPLETLNFSSFANMIKHSITPVDLEMISKKLEEESLRLPESEIENVARLRNIAMDLKYSRDLIHLINTKIENLTRNAEKIERKSHYNGKGMRETLVVLLKQAREAQHFINQKGKSEIKSVLKDFISDISSMINQYISHVQRWVKHEIGRCEPVSRAFNHTVESFCDDIVLPFTACWFSITVSLLLFVPATLLVCILNALFRRIKRSSVRHESILIIDNFEEDHIPLAELDKESSRCIIPSAPSVGNFAENHSEEETWSPGALPQHHYSRPPPYNF